MATQRLAVHFREFLRLLNAHGVEYLLIGGYAVGHYGFPRLTADIDFWVRNSDANNDRIVAVLKSFGFSDETANSARDSLATKVLRFGNPPFRIELMAQISGLDFDVCFSRRQYNQIDGIDVWLIAFDDLLTNKRASGRPKDLIDIEHLGPPKPDAKSSRDPDRSKP